MKWEENERWARALLPSEWTVYAQRDGVTWVWRASRRCGPSGEAAEGVAPSLGDAKRAAVSAYERLSYAFCTESSEDLPHALSSLLEASEMLVKLHADASGCAFADSTENFEQSVAFARSVLSRVPKVDR